VKVRFTLACESSGVESEQVARERILVSIAHPDDDERALGLDQLLALVRCLSGMHDLRALLVFDEVYGFIPPTPRTRPPKRPVVTLN
jgi:hypothetical protein